MRIISHTHDYYDTVQVYGIDQSVKYIRNERSLLKVNLVPHFSEIFNPTGSFNYGRYGSRKFTENFHPIESGLIIFCGKIYPYIVVKGLIKKPHSYWDEHPTHYVYSLEAFEKYFKQYEKNKKIIKNFYKRNLSKYDRNNPRVYSTFFNYSGKTYKGLDDLHFKYESPIIQVKNNNEEETFFDVILKNISFQSVLDPYTAYQELSMYISGVMGGSSPPMVKVSDKVRLEKHGFDKWSFRKMSEK